MRSLLTIICVFLTFNSYAQVGIKTNTPDPSAELEIYSDDKGILLPSYILTDLNSEITPVTNPQEGALIFNTGGTFIRGIYYWDGTSWNRLIVNSEIDQILNLRIEGIFTASNDESKMLIPSGTADNYISFNAANETKYTNTMGIANPTDENISLPAGMYKVDISVDCVSPSSPNSGLFAGNNHLYVLEAAIVDSSNALLTDLKTSTVISTYGFSSVQGYIFSFVFKLDTPKTVKVLLKHGTGRTTNVETRTNQSGLTVNFYKFFE